jgi:hypothetical protein
LSVRTPKWVSDKALISAVPRAVHQEDAHAKKWEGRDTQPDQTGSNDPIPAAPTIVSAPAACTRDYGRSTALAFEGWLEWVRGSPHERPASRPAVAEVAVVCVPDEAERRHGNHQWRDRWAPLRRQHVQTDGEGEAGAKENEEKMAFWVGLICMRRPFPTTGAVGEAGLKLQGDSS